MIFFLGDCTNFEIKGQTIGMAIENWASAGYDSDGWFGEFIKINLDTNESITCKIKRYIEDETVEVTPECQ